MPIGMSYEEAVRRLAQARDLAKDLKKGNRCAVVMGTVLRLQPRKNLGETTLRDLAQSRAYEFRNGVKKTLSHVVADGKYDEAITMLPMPFMDKFYVKAEELAANIGAKYGKPDLSVSGATAWQDGRLALTRGVIIIRDFWGSGGTGDHIDLWDGEQLETYKGKHSVQEQQAAMVKARLCDLWLLSGPLNDGAIRSGVRNAA